MITEDQLDFSPDKSTAVISSAQKFIIPVGILENGGEPLVYPQGPNAGKPIVDWQEKSIGERGVIFFNEEDKSFQAAPGDGSGVVIVNDVNEKEAAGIDNVLREYGVVPGATVTAEIFKKALHQLSRPYVEGGLAQGDMYNSTVSFIQTEMSPVGNAPEHANMYGLFKRDARDICPAVYVPGRGAFKGAAMEPQQFDDGAVILRHEGVARLVQPDAFEETYRYADGRAVKVTDLPVQYPKNMPDATVTGGHAKAAAAGLSRI